MKIVCPTCKSEYRVPDAKIPTKGAYTRCKNCQTRIFVAKESPGRTKDHPVTSQPTDEISTARIDPPVEITENAAAPDDSLSEPEQRVEYYIQQGNLEAAAELLFELIVKHAREKNFSKAEALRDKLYEAAPMALNQIVKSGEILEEEKNQSIDQTYLDVWRDLYERLEPGETSELYYSMKAGTFKAGQSVFKQGDINTNLYFLQSGQFNLARYDPKDQEEKILAELKAGDVANVEPFFSFTVCTTSLNAKRESELTYLEKDILAKWADMSPGLEPKLNSFCHSQKNLVGDLVKKAGINLRAHERFIVSTTAMVQLLDSAAKPVKKPFKITLFDLSAGGFSFGLKINKKEQAAYYLGHHLYMQMIYQSPEGKQKVSQKGRIVAVHLQPFGESSIHVQYQKPLDEKIVALIAHSTPPS